MASALLRPLHAFGSDESISRAAPSLGHKLEKAFDATFASTQALREKQIQQNYRPVIGIHKWFARRPGTLFRSLLLAEFGDGPLREEFWKGHKLRGMIADPFMGGGTTLYEASRLGFSVIGNDVNPMSHWLVERAFDPVDVDQMINAASTVAEEVDRELGHLHQTKCTSCGRGAEVKYFIWVKTCTCPNCQGEVDAFPGYLLAENVRHPRHVVACAACGELGEYEDEPTKENPSTCHCCKASVSVEGNYKRGKVSCGRCNFTFSFPSSTPHGPPSHRLWALEYQCAACYPKLAGRQFKSPDAADHERCRQASDLLSISPHRALIPEDLIPNGDETARLHRWGYEKYREMFNDRQLLFLSTLAARIKRIPQLDIRSALLTVLSDILRYNNMLCRYDTYALKCQDIFSVHGFPVGLVQCENNVLGKPGVGSGGFRHFVEKYVKAKRYCERPFETLVEGKRKTVVYPDGETINPEPAVGKEVHLFSGPSQHVELAINSLDGVFTDPPYFANVQYSELIDFCYVWLRTAVGEQHHSFASDSTRSSHEATGNVTAGRGVEGFTTALSDVYQRFCAALKAGAPLVFTYHHNDPLAYMPLVVAVLDSKMKCSAVFPAAAEMSASMHIANTASSILDSVFVCRQASVVKNFPSSLDYSNLVELLLRDAAQMEGAGVKVSRGDVRCLLAGRIAALSINHLSSDWDSAQPVSAKLEVATGFVTRFISKHDFDEIVKKVLLSLKPTAKGSYT